MTDRIVFEAGVPKRMRVLVTVPEAVLLTEGGIASVGHALEDLGLANVQVFPDPPPADWRPRARGQAAFPDFLVWVQATPSTDTSFSSQIGPGFEVTDSWGPDEFGASKPATSTQSAPKRSGVPGVLWAMTGIVVLAGIAAAAVWERRYA